MKLVWLLFPHFRDEVRHTVLCIYFQILQNACSPAYQWHTLKGRRWSSELSSPTLVSVGMTRWLAFDVSGGDMGPFLLEAFMPAGLASFSPLLGQSDIPMDQGCCLDSEGGQCAGRPCDSDGHGEWVRKTPCCEASVNITMKGIKRLE